MRIHALIAAAGAGSRFATGLPKQYALLVGMPVLRHSIERIVAGFTPSSTSVVIAPDDRWYDEAVGPLPGVTVLRCGGTTRGASIRNALDAMASSVAADDWIVVHDAARPCVDRASLRRLQAELDGDAVGGLLAAPMASTLKRADAGQRVERTEPRAGLWSALTPQMFRYGLLRAALHRPGADQATDEAQAVEATGARPKLVEGAATNIKITYPEDLRLAAAILAAENSA